jgi:hypothetical protein
MKEYYETQQTFIRRGGQQNTTNCNKPVKAVISNAERDLPSPCKLPNRETTAPLVIRRFLPRLLVRNDGHFSTTKNLPAAAGNKKAVPFGTAL